MDTVFCKYHLKPWLISDVHWKPIPLHFTVIHKWMMSLAPQQYCSLWDNSMVVISEDSSWMGELSMSLKQHPITSMKPLSIWSLEPPCCKSHLGEHFQQNWFLSIIPEGDDALAIDVKVNMDVSQTDRRFWDNMQNMQKISIKDWLIQINDSSPLIWFDNSLSSHDASRYQNNKQSSF